MPFNQGINQMQFLASIAPNRSRHSNTFYPEQDILPNTVLLYPGKLNNLGDYKLVFKGAALTHVNLVRAVHNCTLQGNGQIISNFLVDLYNNGLDANSNFNIEINVDGSMLNLNQFKHLTYWLILQKK